MPPLEHKDMGLGRGRPALSVVLPRHGEPASLLMETVAAIQTLAQDDGIEIEIIVVDDSGRADLCDSELAAHPQVLLLSNVRNHGKGYSIRKGVFRSLGTYVGFTDSDLPVDAVHLAEFVQYLQRDEADVVVGSRYSRSTVTRGHALYRRRFSSRIFRAYTRLIAIRTINDSQCPLKVMTREAALAAFSCQRVDGYAFDAELLFVLERLGFRIRALPVTWNDTRAPWSVLKTLSVLVKMLLDVTRVRISWAIRAPRPSGSSSADAAPVTQDLCSEDPR